MKPANSHLILILLTLIPNLLNAQWSTDPTINTPVCTNAGNQWLTTYYNSSFGPLAIATDGNNGLFIPWQDNRNSHIDIYLQKLDDCGNPVLISNGVSICTATNDQRNPKIIPDGAGGAILVWEDFRNSNWDIYAQRAASNGSITWTVNGVGVCTDTAHQQNVMLTTDGSGGAIITWQDPRNGTDDIYAQYINSAGNPVWTANGIPVCSATNNQRNPVILSDNAGGAFVVWQDYRTGSGTTDLYAQRVNSSGGLQWGANDLCICNASSNQSANAIISDGANGFITGWIDFRNGNGDIYTQRVTPAGAPQWGTNGRSVCTNSSQQASLSLVDDSTGGALMAWVDYRNDGGDIYGQRIDSNGTAQWAANGLAIARQSGNQYYNNLVHDGNHGIIVCWNDFRDGQWDVYAQHVDSSGSCSWTTNGVGLATRTDVQNKPAIITSHTNRAIVVWTDERNSNRDIFAQSIFADGTLGVLAADFGDAPFYPTMLDEGGAAHGLCRNLTLGTAVDAETDAVIDPTASADTNDDGIITPNQLDLQIGCAPAIDIQVANNTGATTYLTGWIDYDHDQSWESTERATASAGSGTSVVTLTFPVVPTGYSGETFARFRLSSTSGLLPTGTAYDGEVEDYQIIIAPACPYTVDGWDTDWTGVAGTEIHNAVASNGEWIYTGAADDRRTDSGMSDEADLTEVRLALARECGIDYLYMLFRLKSIATGNQSEVHVALGFDTDNDSGDSDFNFLGDESGLSYACGFLRSERVLSLHTDSGSMPDVEWYNGGSWYNVSGSGIHVSDTHDLVEARVPLTDLNGLGTSSAFILTAATFQNYPVNNQDGNSTDDFGSNDAVDVMGVLGQSGNAWDRDLSDSQVNFGWQIQLNGNGTAPTGTPTNVVMVTNTNDSGTGSLRDAITTINSSVCHNRIHFDISGSGVQTISPTSTLPTITSPVTIDGLTQPGSDYDNHLIEICGSLAGSSHGLTISASDCLIRGLVVNRFSYNGIHIDGGDRNKIQSCYIGLGCDGVTDYGNSQYGMALFYGASDNIIGVDGDGINDQNEGNVISGNNLVGIVLIHAGTDHNRISGNIVGLNAAGNTAVENGWDGVKLQGDPKYNIIGTNSDGISDDWERNVLSGNRFMGVLIEGSGAQYNRVAGNYIGTDLTGLIDCGNQNAGVRINNQAQYNIIGIDSDGSGDDREMNVISGNDQYGIYIRDAGTSQNRIAGNYIGLKSDGREILPNNYSGVYIDRAELNLIGTNNDGVSDFLEHNVISGNIQHGIYIYRNTAINNVIAGNYIGLDRDGVVARPNQGNGIFVMYASNTTIGGTSATCRNIIAANQGHEILLYGSSTYPVSNSIIQNNYLGINAAGDAAVMSDDAGIYLYYADHTTIGGINKGNIIGGNETGIELVGADVANSTFQGNRIGTDTTKTIDLGNNNYGIYIHDAVTNITIGGANPGEGNVIAFSQNNAGIYHNGGAGVSILRNSIYANGGLGIDLGTTGADTNDTNDPDTGANNLQNYPVIEDMEIDGSGDLLITYRVDSSTSYSAYPLTIEFFKADDFLSGEGKEYFADNSYLTGEAQSSKQINLGHAAALGVTDNEPIVAAVTDANGNTSEFSKARSCRNVLYVDTDATGSERGTNWTDAYTDLITALSVAAANSNITEIWVAEGTYYPTTTTNRGETIILRKNLALFGGFAGTETGCDDRDYRAHPTILSGDIGVRDNNNDNSYHVVSGTNLDDTAILDGFVIEDGNATVNYGGGLYLNNSDPVIKNCLFRYNRSTNYGGAVFISNTSSPFFRQCRFFENEVAASGGAVYCHNSTPIFDRSTFHKNSATNAGAIYDYGQVVTITNSIMRNNPETGGYQLQAVSGGSFDLDYVNIEGGFGSGTHLTDTDPHFVDADNGILRLKSSSPCIDAGHPDSCVVDGVADIVDLGAFEYTQTQYQQTISGPGEYTFGDLAAVLDFSSVTNLDAVEIELFRKAWSPHTDLEQPKPVKRYYQITPTATGTPGFTAQITLPYTDQEFAASEITGDESTLFLLRYDTDREDWVRTPTPTIDTDMNLITTTTTGFSEWQIGGQGTPTVTSLVDFSGAFQSDATILLTWTTACELSTLGFVVCRADSEAGVFEPISELIPATGDFTSGGNYTYRDETPPVSDAVCYRLREYDYSGEIHDRRTICVEPQLDVNNESLFTYALAQNYPNPFSTQTTINFQLPQPSMVSLRIYNVTGQLIRTFIDRPLDTGNHSIIWSGKTDEGQSVSSGIYFYELKTPDFTRRRELILMH